MKTIISGLGLTALLLALPTPSSAQVQIGAGVSIDIAFPEPPPLVVVSPGIQVVPEYEEEVYFVNGWYWYRREDVWYRTHDHHGGWRPVRRTVVPVALVRIPPGRFRHYYRDDDGRWRPHEVEEYRSWRDRNPHEDRRSWWHEHQRDQQIRLEQERSWREHQREDRERQRAERRNQQEEREHMRREHEMREHHPAGPPGHSPSGRPPNRRRPAPPPPGGGPPPPPQP